MFKNLLSKLRSKFRRNPKPYSSSSAFADLTERLNYHRRELKKLEGVSVVDGITSFVPKDVENQRGFGAIIWHEVERGKYHTEILVADKPLNAVREVIGVLQEMGHKIAKDPESASSLLGQLMSDNGNCGDPDCPVHGNKSFNGKDIPVA